MVEEIVVRYRPLDSRDSVRPMLEEFLNTYQIIGVSQVRVEPSGLRDVRGIDIYPLNKGGRILGVDSRGEGFSLGKLLRAGIDSNTGKSYLTIDMSDFRCVLHFDHSDSCMRE